MTNVYEVIRSVTNAMGDLAEVTDDLYEKLKMADMNIHTLQKDNVRLEAERDQTEIQNKLLLHDIEEKDKDFKRVESEFNNKNLRIKQLETLLAEANAQLGVKQNGAKKGKH